MTVEPSSPISDFLKTLFCSRFLWQGFGLFWVAMVPMCLFMGLSLYILPAHWLILFIALSMPVFLGILLHRKKHPNQPLWTERRTILQTGRLSQKLGVFFFTVIFLGPLGWGPAFMLLAWICMRVSGEGISLRYDSLFIGLSLVFSLFMATFEWINAVADRKGGGGLSQPMRYLRNLIILLCLISLGFDFGVFDTSSRYRLTVVIETPEGAKTGSGVRRVTTQRLFSLDSGYRSHQYIKGEAFGIDLGDQGTIFALVHGSFNEEVFALENANVAKKTIPLTYYPRLVRFRDIKYPQTVEDLIEVGRTKPSGMPDKLDTRRLEQVLGTGVKIKEITIEKTGDAVTTGIEKRLPWLCCIDPLNSFGSPLKISLLDPTGTYLTADNFQSPVRQDRRDDSICKEYIEKWKAYGQK